MNEYIIDYVEILVSLLSKKQISEIGIDDYINVLENSIMFTGYKIIKQDADKNYHGYCQYRNKTSGIDKINISPSNLIDVPDKIRIIIDNYRKNGIKSLNSIKRATAFSSYDNSMLNFGNSKTPRSVTYQDYIDMLSNLIFSVIKYKKSLRIKNNKSDYYMSAAIIPIFSNKKILEKYLKKLIFSIDSIEQSILIKNRYFNTVNKGKANEKTTEEFLKIRNNFINEDAFKKHLSLVDIDELKHLLPYYLTQIIKDMGLEENELPERMVYLTSNADYESIVIPKFVYRLAANNLIYGILKPITNKDNYEKNLNTYRIWNLFKFCDNVNEFFFNFNRINIIFNRDNEILYNTLKNILIMENKELGTKMLDASAKLVSVILGIAHSQYEYEKNEHTKKELVKKKVNRDIDAFIYKTNKVVDIVKFNDFMELVHKSIKTNVFTVSDLKEIYDNENEIKFLMGIFKAGLSARYTNKENNQ